MLKAIWSRVVRWWQSVEPDEIPDVTDASVDLTLTVLQAYGGVANAPPTLVKLAAQAGFDALRDPKRIPDLHDALLGCGVKLSAVVHVASQLTESLRDLEID
jgi:hypothetical protein